jgi:hypothetical protein
VRLDPYALVPHYTPAVKATAHVKVGTELRKALELVAPELGYHAVGLARRILGDFVDDLDAGRLTSVERAAWLASARDERAA